MRPTQVRYDYVIAKGRAFKKLLKPRPSLQFKKLLESYRVRVECLLDLESPFVIKHADKYIIALPPMNEDEQRLMLIKQFAHIYLGHFEVYHVDRMVSGDIIEYLDSDGFEILKKEVEIFTREIF